MQRWLSTSFRALAATFSGEILAEEIMALRASVRRTLAPPGWLKPLVRHEAFVSIAALWRQIFHILRCTLQYALSPLEWLMPSNSTLGFMLQLALLHLVLALFVLHRLAKPGKAGKRVRQGKDPADASSMTRIRNSRTSSAQSKQEQEPISAAEQVWRRIQQEKGEMARKQQKQQEERAVLPPPPAASARLAAASSSSSSFGDRLVVQSQEHEEDPPATPPSESYLRTLLLPMPSSSGSRSRSIQPTPSAAALERKQQPARQALPLQQVPRSRPHRRPEPDATEFEHVGQRI